MTIQQFLNRENITASAEWADDNPAMSDMPAGSSHWRVTFRRAGDQRRRMTTPFSMGPAHSSEPTAREVFECLVSDASGSEESFDDFCSNFGFDEDSRKAERTYKAVQRQTAKLRQFLGPDLFDVALGCDRE